MKVLLVLVDGMRPDALASVSAAQAFLKESAYTLSARTVMPSVTLPCHMSLFHSVDPDRHGTTTNTYTPQVRPIRGLFDILAGNRKKCVFFYNWEQLRDISRPSALDFSFFCRGRITPKEGEVSFEEANNVVTDAAVAYLKQKSPDCTFLYLGYLDEAGHKEGWLSDAYMAAMENSWANIGRVLEVLPEDYTVIITADHGGHDRSHGTSMPEDMTIPVMIRGKDFPAGKELQNVSIKDIAPTIAALLGAQPEDEREGKSLL